MEDAVRPPSAALDAVMTAAEDLLLGGGRGESLSRLQAAIADAGLQPLQAELAMRYGFAPPDDWQLLDRVFIRARNTLMENGYWPYGPRKVRDQMGLLAPGLARVEMKGARTLEFGAGVFAPHLLSTVFYAMGAESCLSIEPDGVVDAGSASRALVELITAILTRPAAWEPLGLDRTAILPRLAAFDIEALAAGDIYGGLGRSAVEHRAVDIAGLASGEGFDFVFSIAVLEHVKRAELSNTLQRLAAAMRPAGVMCHAVDFTDHNFHAGVCSHRWGYLIGEGDGYGVNLVPLSGLIAAHEQAGLEVLQVVRHTAEVPDFVRPRLLPEYAGRSDEDLETHLGVIVSRRR